MTMKTKGWIIVLIIVVCGCASQQDIATLDHRITDMDKRNITLETQLTQLKAQLAEYEKNNDKDRQNLRNQTAAFYAELEKLEDQVQLLNGTVEESAHAVNDKTDGMENQMEARGEKINKIEGSVDINSDRIVRLERYLGFESPDKLAATIVPAKNPDKNIKNQEASSDSALYANAKQAFDRNDFEIAREGFQQVLKRFPASPNADNAQFWIGEIYYQDKWYEKAILEYQKVIETYPKGNKVPAALLKQGLAFNKLRDTANCRLILQELVDRFPKSPEADIAKKKLTELK